MSHRSRHPVVCATALSCLFLPSPLNSYAQTAHTKAAERLPLRVQVMDANKKSIADSGSPPHTSGQTSVALAFQHEYQPGDQIFVTGPPRIAIRVDDRIPECLVYLANSPHGAPFSFNVPFGQGEPATRSAFSQDSFAGASHRITARVLTPEERSGYRNLALNSCDQELPPPAVAETPGEPQSPPSPHASTNSVSRSLPDFRARNAIDGMFQNGHHGMWPFQSWGPELRDDLWWKVDFGRPVELDKVRIMERADFPHDSYWQSAVLEFSDGATIPIQFKQSAEFQEFSFPKRTVSWVRLNKLVPADPARWCSFVEVEAWGHDLK